MTETVMPETLAFVTELARQDIKLWLDGDQLRINARAGAITPPLVAQLKERKPAIMRFLRAYASGPVVTTLKPTVRPAQVPLSFAQQRLWFLAQFEGSQGESSETYTIHVTLRLCGPLAVAALRASCRQLEERHETLRTTFPIVDGQAYQQINPPSFALEEIDLAGLTNTQQASEVERLARLAAAYAFDLVAGPLWRVALLRLGAQEHVLLVTMHHIISDGWSMGVLTRDLSVLYAQECGQPPATLSNVALPPLPMHYADYAVWQRGQLQGAALAEQISYWQKQLAGAPPLLTLPTDQPRPAVQRQHGAELTVTLAPTLTAHLKSLAQRDNATLFMLLQAAFAVLLARYAGQEDILVGTPVANRQITEIENLIGFFVNTLVLRNDLTGNPTFRELLARVRQMTLAAFDRQALPFELVVEALQPERTLAHSPLFQVMFVLQNNRQPTLALADVTLTPLEVEHATVKFDLTLMLWEHAGGLVAAWRYNTDLFARATIERMAGHYQTLLEAIVRDPDQPVARLPLLTERERVQILVEWNDRAPSTSSVADGPTGPRPKLVEGTVPELVEGQCIHQLFEAQAERTPDAIAVISGERQLSYRELNARANQLAHYLIAQRVGPDKLVGLFTERSLEMVVGVLGILKAGGAYVPLDPTLPTERLQMMLEDMQSTLVVTQRHLLGNLPGDAQIFVCLDDEDGCLRQASEENPNRDVQPSDLAYILYTSGSTGKPKGVAVEHRQVVAYGQGVIARCELEPGLRYAMLQPLTVDSSVTMLFPSLWTGGVLQVIDRELALNANALAATFQRAAIDCLKIAPSHLAALLTAAADPQAILPRKRLIIGGEASQWQWVQDLLNAAPCHVYNHYGPTETTVGVLTYRVQPDPTGQRFQTTPLGYPLPNTQTYILDSLLQPLPIGALGELYIGGALVTRGYLNRPDLTAERFIPNPLAPEGAGRLYKTGDWARYLPDGAIEFFGRMDGQVKIRGFRIELGEIEAHLRAHPQVREAIVVAREKENGQKQLVAYVVPARETGRRGDRETGRQGDKEIGIDDFSPCHLVTLSGLRDYLKQKLPDYMLPAAFVILDGLPLSAHGKLDRLALPAPDYAVEEVQRILPRTPTEKLLAAIWQEVLGLAQVGVTDNFFQVGGDSIISIQIVSRARSAGLHLTPKDLFQYQTIAGLAGIARAAQPAQAEQGIVTGTLPLTPIQQRFFAQPWPEPHHFNQAFLLELSAEVNPTWLHTAVGALLTHHDALRLRFDQQGDDWQSRIVAPATGVPFEVIDLSALHANEWTTVLEEQANVLQASLHLMQGPLMRVALFQTPVTNYLLIAIHHLAVDGVSWRILLEDLQRSYQQLAQGEAIQLPAKSTSFKAWATLLYEKGVQVVADERAYWTQLVAARRSLLPVDHRLGPNDQASIAHITTRLDRTQTAALLHQAPAVYHTQINDLLLTALLLACHAWTGQPFDKLRARSGLLIELEGHGREDLFAYEPLPNPPLLGEGTVDGKSVPPPSRGRLGGGNAVDLARTVGWFTTIFPVWLECAAEDLGTLDLGELIKQVKEQLRQIPRRGIGYGVLRYLDKMDALAANAEVRFNYLGQFDSMVSGSLIKAIVPEAAGLTRSPLGLRTTLLDINASVIEGELQVNWSYSRNFHRAATIQQVADAFLAALHRVIAHCQAPTAGGYTPSDFPDIRLRQEKLDLLLAEIAIANKADAPCPDPVELIYPLSPSQQGMLLETLAFPHSGVHIEQSVFSWHGPLNLTAFTRAWQQIVARHAMLRTGFAWEDQAEPLQFVLRQAELPITWQSLTDLSAVAQQARIDDYLVADRQRGFQPMQAPLMRFACFQTAAEINENVYQLVWTRHHILTDGWSSSLLLKELLAFYQAECTGQPLPLPPTRPYRDYISWLRGQDIEGSATFWRTSLQGFTAPTALATKAPSDEDREVAKHPAYTEMHLSAAASANLYQRGQQHGVTTNSLIQAGWALALHHHSGATDVLFGATVAGRPPEVTGVEAMVGLFINTLPVRMQLAPAADTSLLAWLQSLQQQNVAQQPHAYCSAGQIQQWSAVPASLPLYASLLVFENYPLGASKATQDTRFEIRAARSIGAQTTYALTLLVTPGPALILRAVYDTTRFAADDIDRLLTRLLTLLEAMSTAPHQPLRTLLRQDGPLSTVYPVQKHASGQGVALVPPRTAVEQQLVQIWQAVLGSPAIGIRDHFFALGGHSFVAVQLMAQIQRHFALNLPLATLFHYPTIAQLAIHLAQFRAGQKVEWPTLVPIQLPGTLPPFFCVPGAGGNVLYLYALARFLGVQQPFYGLQAVGLDGETPPHTTIEAIAAHNITAIQRVQPQGPYLLGGHSFGGKVAFEMAQQLLRAGERVAHLLLLDTAAPAGVAKQDAAKQDDAWWLMGVVGAFSAMIGQSPVLTAAELRGLDAEQQLIRFKQALEALNFLPPTADLRQARGLVEVFKCNRLTDYAPSNLLPVPITLFRAAETVAGNPEAGQPLQDPSLGWEQLTQGAVEVIWVPGNHLSMMARPQVEILAKRMQTSLSRTRLPIDESKGE